MLFFVDESGQDRGEAPYEVLAAVAIRECELWNLLQAIQAAERDMFGVRLVDVGVEFKGRKLLKPKTFRHSQQAEAIPAGERRALCAEFFAQRATGSSRRSRGATSSKRVYSLRTSRVGLCQGAAS